MFMPRFKILDNGYHKFGVSSSLKTYFQQFFSYPNFLGGDLKLPTPLSFVAPDVTNLLLQLFNNEVFISVVNKAISYLLSCATSD